MRNQRFHLADAAVTKNTEGLYDKALADEKITDSDAALIREFVNELAGKVSPGREYKLVNSLILNRAFFPPYSECTTGDIYAGVRKITAAEKADGTPRFKANTKTDRVKIAKRFFLWMCENGYGKNINEKKLRKLQPPSPDRMTKTAAQILTEEEIQRMLEAANNSRDRALLSVLYEGGLRASELGDLTWGELRFTSWNVVLNTAGKTGKPRYVPLVLARPYLAQWKNDYPGDAANPASYVFVTLRSAKRHGREYLPLTYSTVYYLLQTLAELAGVEKHITPHIFRHSRVTHLLQQRTPLTHVCKMMWGNLDTKQIQTYAHLVNEDMDDYIADLYGIEREEDEEKAEAAQMLSPRQCKNCGTVNGPTQNYCGVCGEPLTEDAKDQAQRRREELNALLADDAAVLETLQMIRSLQAEKEARG